MRVKIGDFEVEARWVKACKNHICKTCRGLLPKGGDYYEVKEASGSQSKTLPRAGRYCEPKCVVRRSVRVTRVAERTPEVDSEGEGPWFKV